MSVGKKGRTSKKVLKLSVVVAVLSLLSIFSLCLIGFIKERSSYSSQEFFTPSQVQAGEALEGVDVMVAGVVTPDSHEFLPNGSGRFMIQDADSSIFVHYEGVLPDLFMNGYPVAILGSIQPGTREITAKSIYVEDLFVMVPGSYLRTLEGLHLSIVEEIRLIEQPHQPVIAQKQNNQDIPEKENYPEKSNGNETSTDREAIREYQAALDRRDYDALTNLENPMFLLDWLGLASSVERSELVFENGQTPLHYAISQEDSELVGFLLADPVNIDKKDSKGVTPLVAAIQLKDDAARRGIVGQLLDAGAAVDVREGDSWPPLLNAALVNDIEVVKKLVDSGADIFASSESGATVLHAAVYHSGGYYSEEGRLPLVEYFISKGVPVNVMTNNGITPLHRAIYNQWIASANALLAAGADVNLGSDVNYSALHFAVVSGNIPMVEQLLALGADASVRSKVDGSTPLHEVGVMDRNYYTTPDETMVKMVELLVAAGADLNVKNSKTLTPLFLALTSMREKTAQALVEAGADVNVPSRLGTTPLMVALNYGLVESVRNLLNAGADVNAQDVYGQSVLDWLNSSNSLGDSQRVQVESMLLSGGARRH